METINFKSTEAIQERLSILEDQELASDADIEIWYKEFQGGDSEIISEVEIEKLGLHYTNISADDELSDLHAAYDSERAADYYWRQ